MRINRLLIAGIVSVGLLTSCANNEESGGGTSSPAIVKLTLSTGSTTKTGGGTTYTGSTGNLNHAKRNEVFFQNEMIYLTIKRSGT
jgi:hypothetical protein